MAKTPKSSTHTCSGTGTTLAAAYAHGVPEHRFFPYDFDSRFKAMWWPLGVREGRDGVTLTEDGRFVATFGRFDVDTPIHNIAETTVTGDYRWWTAVGVRLSMVDSGVTFGTTPRQGLCVTFTEKVPAVIGRHDHRGLTVTVSDPEGLAEAIAERAGG